MTDKRSPPPATEKHEDARPASRPRLDDDPGPAPPAQASEDAGEADTAAAVVGEKEDGAEEEQKEEQPEEEEREKGIKPEELKTIREAYEDGYLDGYTDAEDIVYPHKAELNDKNVIWRGDITKLAVDCIVNAANKSLLGGVDGAIHSAAGPTLYDECEKLNGADTGETKLTGGHRLPAKHIAHTVGPIFSRNKRKWCEEKLRSCYTSTLELCVEKGLRSVAFSGISTGVYGYPLDAAAQIACDEVRKFLEGEDGDKIDYVVFCVFRQIDFNSYLDNVPAYFPPPPGFKKTVKGDAADDKASKEDAGPGKAAEETETLIAGGKKDE
ncbi:macro domain containing protein [Rhodotorula toruloides]|uniref:Macro domain containing protein n=1 Tax=Rhodotorula toruloides TaxID=5286 RepID=A0A511KPY0_RHOTO|nr:macro domain containing protein [Rhodotorula toruloides]